MDTERCISFTLGHAKDGGEPDEILLRPILFNLYVNNTTQVDFFSHDPTNPIGESFPREVQFLKEIITITYKKQAQFKKEGTLWKLIW